MLWFLEVQGAKTTLRYLNTGLLWGRTLRKKLLFSFLLLSLIPFAAASLISYRTVVVEAEESVMREMGALAEATGKSMSLFMSDLVREQIVWSNLTIFREATQFSEVRSETEHTFKAIIDHYPCYQAIMLMNKEGLCVVSTSNEFAGKDFSQSDHFLKAIERSVSIQSLYQDSRIARIAPESQGWTASVSVPIRHKGVLLGVLCSFVKWSAVESILAETRVGRTGYVFMVDHERKIIGHPSRELYNQPITGPKISVPALEQALKQGETGAAFTIRNVRTNKWDFQIAGIAYPQWPSHLSGLGWALVAGADTSETMAFVPLVIRNLILVGAGIVVLVIGFSFLLTRIILRPITAVADQVTQAGEGNMAVDFNADRADEELRPLINAIKTYYLMVEVRAKELSQANELLRREIRERQAAEEEQKKIEERYRTLFEESKDAILIVLPEGEILDANPACSELFGAPRKQIVGSNVLQFYQNPSDRVRFSQEMASRGFVREFRWLIRRADGKTRICMLTSSAWRNEAGTIQAHFSISRDITESTRLEKQLVQAQKMEAVGTLAGGVAHDFNNILQAIKGYTSLLLFDKQQQEPEFAKLTAIDKSVERAAQLVKQLLLFSRKMETERRPLDLNLEVEHARSMLERTIPKMIDIEIHPGRRLWTIRADPVQIEQVLLNLGGNAADAMVDGGKLIIKTENITLDESFERSHLDAAPGNYVLLAVSDTGHGINQEVIPHIFDPFYTTKGIGRGTGLGLSSVYGIVKNHGGHILCYSAAGQGTTFKIYFPAVEDACPEKDDRYFVTPLKGGQETILLADDEQSIRETTTDILISFGYTVISVSSGEEALEVFTRQASEIGLVILDIGMPGMGGHKCLSEILKINPATKIIIASGYSGDHHARKSLAAGALEFIGKPYQLDALLKKIRAVLDEKLVSHDSRN